MSKPFLSWPKRAQAKAIRTAANNMNESNWCTGLLNGADGTHCALGHLQEVTKTYIGSFPSSNVLRKISNINDSGDLTLTKKTMRQVARDLEHGGSL